MENVIENIRASVWSILRNVKEIKILLFNFKKPFFCLLGFHKMRRGFGWSGDKRMDVCLHNECNFSKWHTDKIGNELIRTQNYN